MKNLFVIALLLFFPLHCHEYKSQYDQDRFVNEHFFHDKQGGFFLDIGAHDGQTGSNSYFFEKELGWEGICFEPLPHLFAQLRECRACACVNACVSASQGLLPFLHVDSCDEQLSGLAGTYDQRALNAVMYDISQLGGAIKMLQLPSVRLMAILEQHGITHVDFLSLDTEGSELEILKTIDFSKIIIDVITVENNYNETFIYDFLIEQGFKFVVRIGVDDLYVREGF
jgi:FkbM family methyltransferase